MILQGARDKAGCDGAAATGLLGACVPVTPATPSEQAGSMLALPVLSRTEKTKLRDRLRRVTFPHAINNSEE